MATQTKSEGTAYPEGTLPQMCLQQGSEKVNQSPPFPALPAPGSAGQKPLVQEGLLAELYSCLSCTPA